MDRLLAWFSPLLLLFLPLLLSLFPTAVDSASIPDGCPRNCSCVQRPQTQWHVVCKWTEIDEQYLSGGRWIHAGLPVDQIRTLAVRCGRGTPPVRFPSDWLRYLRYLDRFELDGCPLADATLPAHMLQTSSQLYSLILRRLGLRHVPAELLPRSLLLLDVAHNSLERAPSSLHTLTSLGHLDLSFNRIAYLEPVLSSLSKLKATNPTRRVHPSSNVQVLSLDSNQLAVLDTRALPDSLTDLSARDNRISVIQHAHLAVPELSRLDVRANQLQWIASSGWSNRLPDSLQTVLLANNSIRRIADHSFANHSRLETIDLSHNLLSSLSAEAVAVRADEGDQIRQLHLVGNPLQCLCTHDWIRAASARHNKSSSLPMVVGASVLECVHPVTERRQPLVTADRSLCTYSAICPEDCDCCESGSVRALDAQLNDCPCWRRCPLRCQCFAPPQNSGLPGRDDDDGDDYMTASDDGHWLVCDVGRHWSTLKLSRAVTHLRLLGTLPESATSPHARLAAATQLRWLNVSGVEADRIPPGLIDGARRLRVLDLSHNRLHSLNITQLARLPRLRELYAHGNPLLPPSLNDVRWLRSLQTVSLAGNSSTFECGCKRDSPLQEFVKDETQSEKIIDADSLTCRLSDISASADVPSTVNVNNVEEICESLATTTTTAATTTTTTTAVKSSTNGSGRKSTAPGRMAIDSGSEEEEDDDDYYDEEGAPVQVNKPVDNDDGDDKDESSEVEDDSSTENPLPIVPFQPPAEDPTPRQQHRGKGGKEKDELDDWLNLLVIALIACLLLLFVTISFTIYFRFSRLRSSMASEQTTRGQQDDKSPELQPLNGRNR